MEKPRKGAPNKPNSPEAVIEVRVLPRSSRLAISQESSGAYKVWLTATPVDGAANHQLIQVLAKQLSIAARSVQILTGETSRRKRIRIQGLHPQQVSERLQSK